MATVLTPSMLPAKIAVKIRVDAETGCWLWIGYIDGGGYGEVHWPPGSQKKHRAHRLVWELLKGPIPNGMVLDHSSCGVHACVNPTHLEPVTHAENSRRIGGVPNKNGLCRKRKHPWIPANIRIESDGQQRCLRCQEERTRRYTAAGRGHKTRRPGTGQQSFL